MFQGMGIPGFVVCQINMAFSRVSGCIRGARTWGRCRCTTFQGSSWEKRVFYCKPGGSCCRLRYGKNLSLVCSFTQDKSTRRKAQKSQRNKINIWLRSCYTNLAVKSSFLTKKFVKLPQNQVIRNGLFFLLFHSVMYAQNNIICPHIKHGKFQTSHICSGVLVSKIVGFCRLLPPASHSVPESPFLSVCFFLGGFRDFWKLLPFHHR